MHGSNAPPVWTWRHKSTTVFWLFELRRVGKNGIEEYALGESGVLPLRKARMVALQI
jgi:hypothetical protein